MAAICERTIHISDPILLAQILVLILKTMAINSTQMHRVDLLRCRAKSVEWSFLPNATMTNAIKWSIIPLLSTYTYLLIISSCHNLRLEIQLIQPSVTAWDTMGHLIS